ncbi:site-specific integrase [Frankia sp. AiPs1]|uniref:tyrosine-type recombinase/integrase n=1 Tax=Frankia sp. AiPs1 TaxID=573493 RepID=UPI002043B2B3|nr:tyrosine-type recombinase/integrase [Frankia sp. AiPs1]MCM3921807.1 site-specific integrase [Frankia sp. AiPs1]
MTLYRDFDGSTIQVERWGASNAAAERNLKEALRDRITQAGGGDEITRESRVQDLAEHWWAEFSKLGRSPGTLRLYRDRLDNQVIPALGKLRIRELTTAAVNRHIRSVTDRNGAAVAKAVRTVLSNMCGHACRLDAMTINPCREVAPVKPKVKNPPRALTAAEVNQLRASLTYDDAALRQELPDIVDAMLATSLRIAEVLAIQWPDLDLDAATIKTGNVVVRIKGEGLQIKSDPTSKVNARTLLLPQWGVELFRRRWASRVAPTCDYDPVFMSSVRTLKDPDNAHTQLREAFDRMAYDWLVPHHLRKTAATTLDKEGLSAREIADQLGHAKTSMTLDSYMGRKVINPRAAAALEVLAP